jgi:7,8-dihydropterin-6-yl-methyl-4-(beta-D-ribofuranosyl)aminobenzene 5'-phosphate synthase
MSHGDAEVRVTNGPTVIAPGIALLPPLPAVLFWMGEVEEQALVVNVRGLGLVLVSGCGHPGIAPMLAVTERLLETPLHAVVGGLHLPVHPVGTYWVPATVAAPQPPWRPLGDRDVDDAITELQRRHPTVVAVSGHDTTPAALRRFADALGPTFTEVRVGEEIGIGATTTASTP